MSNRENVAHQALALPPEDRAYVIDLLEQSLEAEGLVDSGVAATLDAEIRRRIEAYDRGESRAIDVTTAMAGLRQRLNERRSDSGR